MEIWRNNSILKIVTFLSIASMPGVHAQDSPDLFIGVEQKGGMFNTFNLPFSATIIKNSDRY